MEDDENMEYSDSGVESGEGEFDRQDHNVNVVLLNAVHDTPLRNAVLREDIGQVQRLIRERPDDVNAEDGLGCTLLHLAAQAGYIDIARLLINDGTINAQNFQNETPLHYAVHSGHEGMVRLLLRHGAIASLDVRDQRGEGNKPLSIAQLRGYESIVTLLNDYHEQSLSPSALAECSKMNSSGNVFAVNSGRGDFSDRGAGVTGQRLHPVTSNDEIILNFRLHLPEVKAETDNNNGNNGTTGNDDNDTTGMAQYLCQFRLSSNGAQEPNLQSTDSNTKGNNMNKQDRGGNTALHRAVAEGDISKVGLLVGRGANVNIANRDDMTPLHVAANMGNIEMYCYLRKLGAKQDLENICGETPIEILKQCIHRGMAIFQLRKHSDKDKCVWLHEAFNNQAAHLARLLINSISNDAIVSYKSSEGSTFLHMAIHMCNQEIVKKLIKKGINVNCQDSEGNTPLHCAAFVKNAEIVSILIASGAIMDIRNKAGDKPVYFANKNIIIIDLFRGEGDELSQRELDIINDRKTLSHAAHKRTNEDNEAPMDLRVNRKYALQNGEDSKIKRGRYIPNTEMSSIQEKRLPINCINKVTLSKPHVSSFRKIYEFSSLLAHI